ncbi:hypothetical protein BST16_20160 [Mycobacterium asiaticum DSM 44297]|nr:hypothetical protein BST16_20160 [Mycobacterium asiaticum DSM 44297]
MVSLGIALLAIGVALGAWLRPLPKNEPPPAPTYTSQQVADAKVKVCAAYAKVREALTVAGARGSSNDPTVSLAIATASRQALDVGSRYLLTTLTQERATASELASATRALANLYQELTVSYLADKSDTDIAQLRQAAEAPTATIDKICK